MPSMPAKQAATRSTSRRLFRRQQELVLPTRELRQQPGYEQVTVTVTEPSGTYVTGLQKGDFKLYMTGNSARSNFSTGPQHSRFARHPGGHSGSMTRKFRRRAAIAQFLRDLNDKDDVFLFAFSSHPFLLQPFTENHIS